MRPPELIDLVSDLLAPRSRVASLDSEVGAALAAHGHEGVHAQDLGGLAGAGLDGVLLLSGEVAMAGVRGPTLIAAAVSATRPGALVALAAPSAVHVELTGGGRDGVPALTAEQAEHLLAERGLAVELVAGVGASARLAGRGWRGRADLAEDRIGGLRDAGSLVLAAGTTPRNSGERSERFFASITRKIVAASVVCLDDDDRLLLVDDLFKGVWTLPGGLVDAHEVPDAAAIREAWEEGGVRVVLGALLGVFAHDPPDSVHLVYAARPAAPTPEPTPLHDHEIGAARWVTREEAERMLPAGMRRKVAACLDQPGRTWGW